MPYYSLELILHTGEHESCSTVKNYLVEWVQEFDVIEGQKEPCAQGKDFIVHARAQDPTVIFDACAQFGRIKSVKINED